MTSELWGPEIAAPYDADAATMFAPEVLGPAVDLLVELAGDGRALEMAVGTGRVAIPLAERGVPVCGIELSEPMAAQLRGKAGDLVPVTMGDMATTRVPGEFRVVYLVFNTLSNLLTQDAQVDCFINAARHLEPGGRFVVELGVPPRLPPGVTSQVFTVEQDYLGVDTYDLVSQRLVSHHARSGRPITHPEFRFAWPAELDLMARIAGLRLEHRWADWRREPFTAASGSHVSVWRRP